MRNLTPLARSAELPRARDYALAETELKQLFIRLWQDLLSGRAQDVNVYGMPHLGSASLARRVLAQEGVATFPDKSMSDEGARWMLRATRDGRRRGTALLATLLKLAWGDTFNIQQLWQKKSARYPDSLATLGEIEANGNDIADYYLTSRLRIAINSPDKPFPQPLREATRSVLPARLMVDTVVNFLSARVSTLYLACIASVVRRIDVAATCRGLTPPQRLTWGIAASAQATRRMAAVSVAAPDLPQ